jgi:serine/threonine-protein kinase RsbT
MITLSFPIRGGDFDSAGLATCKLKEQLARIGVGAPAMRKVMIASYEAEMNVVIHARTGTLWARLDQEKLDLEIADEGPGIPDVELAMREGWSTASARAREMGFGAGLGLPNIRRNSDLFEIESRVGRGTRVRSTIMLGSGDTAKSGALEAPAPAALLVNGERCRGCLRCIFVCPTAALRVRENRPTILEELCIGCTACVEVCPDAVFAVKEDREPSFKDAVLIIQRGFLSGFPLPDSPARVLGVLHELGFAEVRIAEEWEDAMRNEARLRASAPVAASAPLAGSPGALPHPVILPLCPGVVALVESRFPSLIPNLGPWRSPLEAAGEEFPLRPVIAAAACPAQLAAVRKESITGRLTAVSATRLAQAVLPLLSAGAAAARGARLPSRRGGEPELGPGELAVTGISHVRAVLSAVEAGALPDVTLLDLSLCEGGCSGSPLLCAEPALSAHRWRQAAASLAGGDASAAAGGAALDAAADAGAGPGAVPAGAVRQSRPHAARRGVRLDPDMGEAIRKLSRIGWLTESLPGRDCGACGAPSCGAFAEDVVLGRAAVGACPHRAATEVKA